MTITQIAPWLSLVSFAILMATLFVKFSNWLKKTSQEQVEAERRFDESIKLEMMAIEKDRLFLRYFMLISTRHYRDNSFFHLLTIGLLMFNLSASIMIMLLGYIQHKVGPLSTVYIGFILIGWLSIMLLPFSWFRSHETSPNTKRIAHFYDGCRRRKHGSIGRSNQRGYGCSSKRSG